MKRMNVTITIEDIDDYGRSDSGATSVALTSVGNPDYLPAMAADAAKRALASVRAEAPDHAR